MSHSDIEFAVRTVLREIDHRVPDATSLEQIAATFGTYEFTDDDLKVMEQDVYAMRAIAESAQQTLVAAIEDIRAAQRRALDIAYVALCEQQRCVLLMQEYLRALDMKKKRDGVGTAVATEPL